MNPPAEKRSQTFMIAEQEKNFHKNLDNQTATGH